MDNALAVPRTSRFCPTCPPNQNKDYITATSPTRCLFKFYNCAWRSYSNEDMQRLNAALISNDIESDSIPEFLNRFFPNHPLARFAFSFNSEDHGSGRGHPVVIHFRPIDASTARTIDILLSKKESNLPISSASTVSSLSSSSPYGLTDPRFIHPSTPEFDSDVSSSPDSVTLSSSPQSHETLFPTSSPSPTVPLTLAFEFSSGVCVLRKRQQQQELNAPSGSPSPAVWEALVIRREGDQFYEVAKGHLEQGETLQEAAEREMREETGILNRISVGNPLISEIYTVKTAELSRVEKTVHYFEAELLECSSEVLISTNDNLIWSTDACPKCCAAMKHKVSVSNIGNGSASHSPNPSTTTAECEGTIHCSSCCSLPECVAYFGEREEETRELLWVSLVEAERLFFKSNTIMNLVFMALTRKQEEESQQSSS